MKIKFQSIAVVFFIVHSCRILTLAQEYKLLNYADPEVHPYADPEGGRDAHRYTDKKVNELRLYDFYSRQADYYLEQEEIPEIIPAYPGMDAGINSHWGTHPQVHYYDDAWSRMDSGSAVGGVMVRGDESIMKGIHLRLDQNVPLFATFDPIVLSYRKVWGGIFLTFPRQRWGITGFLERGGEVALNALESSWSAYGELEGSSSALESQYHGFYRHGDKVVFKYSVHGAEILDLPGALDSGSGPIFTRTLKFSSGSSGLKLTSFFVPDGATRFEMVFPKDLVGIVFKTDAGTMGLVVRSSGEIDGIELDLENEGSLSVAIPSQFAGNQLNLYAWNSDLDLATAEMAIRRHEADDPSMFIRGGSSRWPEEIAMQGELGMGDDPYLVDTIPVPLENPYGSPMFLTGLDFFENGDAAVSTFFGDVWIVRGLDTDLKAVRWKRIAHGLNQPLGLVIVDGKIHTLGKDQITILHDLNGDDETDFFENFCNTYQTSIGSHDYNTGFQRDAAGNFYFATKHIGVVKVSPDGKTVRSLGRGLRNPNGIGVSPDGRIWSSPQEGQWTPASQISRIQPDGYYGFQKHIDNLEITPATAYIPRGVDNSTGGSVYITTDRWGPMKDKLIAFSYGASSHFLVLEDETGPSVQGAIVPLKGDFLSGTHRGRVHPVDGQVYVVGSQGWMNYAIQDGSFERIRYTGKPVYYPSGFQVSQNGIRVDFSEPLSKSGNEDSDHYFAQQWQYLYSMGYGSPELSIRNPDTVGHDPLSVNSATVGVEGKSLFLEIPDLAPAMTVHLRLHLEFADGNPFATDLFATIHQLGDPFTQLSSPAPPISGKPHSIHLPMREAPPPPEVEPGSDEPGRLILLRAVTGLKYDQERIVVQAGERISLTLTNTDEMPHNWILTGWFTYERVGQLADAMVADPTAAERHYVPDDDSVLLSTRLLNPGESQTIHFNAPAAPGEYPYLCTFPGHWQAMKGILIVH